MTSNYPCPRCMVAGLCLGTNGLQAEWRARLTGLGVHEGAGACHPWGQGMPLLTVAGAGSSAPCWAPFHRDNWIGLMLLVQMQGGSSLVLTARSP